MLLNEDDFVNIEKLKFTESFQLLTNVKKEISILEVAGVLDLVLLLHCSIKVSFFLIH